MDLTTVGISWPVAERYELAVDVEPGIGDREVHRVRASGEIRGTWVPGLVTDLADQIAALAGTNDTGLYRWVVEHGFLGLARDAQAGETLEDIREAVEHLAKARRLLRAVLDGRPPDELRMHAAEAAGHLVDADQIASAAGFVRSEPGRKGASADIQALRALGVALTWPLQRWTWLIPVVQATQKTMRLTAQVVGAGPLGVAYIQTLREATELTIGHRAGVIRLDWRSQRRRCQRCGVEFIPKRETQLYHDKRCRWAAQKSATRRIAR